MYKSTGDVVMEKVIEGMIQDKPVIVNVDRLKLYNKVSSAKAPHYVVLLKKGNDILVFDPKNDEPFMLDFPSIYTASVDMNAVHHNGIWLFCR
jgi:hypothetical protein